MIAESGMVMLAFFAGIYWNGKRGIAKSVNQNCYVCGKSIGAESNVTDHRRRIFYHFGCWTGSVKNDVFSTPDNS